jgi:hypothetical protein
MSLTSNGALSGGLKSFLVASASPGLKWSDVTFTLDGATQAISATATDCSSTTPAAARYAPCGPALETAAAVANAGDAVRLNTASGQTLRVLDTASNSVMLTLTVS